jgi:predicted unusual protein kinase regulating ubiquinone biosynthesis (AarF/ABC1/UbiB family)
MLIVNVDPHPGNYLFHDDGSVTFLDFGCVKRIPGQFVAIHRAIARAAFAGDAQATWRINVEAGYLKASDPVEPEEIYRFWRDRWSHLFEAQPARLTPELGAANICRNYSFRGPAGNAIRHMALPGEMILMCRVDLGLMSFLCELRAAADWFAIHAELDGDAAPETELGRLEAAFFRRDEVDTRA